MHLLQVQTHAAMAFNPGLIDTPQSKEAMGMQLQVEQAIHSGKALIPCCEDVFWQKGRENRSMHLGGRDSGVVFWGDQMNIVCPENAVCLGKLCSIDLGSCGHDN